MNNNSEVQITIDTGKSGIEYNKVRNFEKV
jgi:hypothetical protein